MKATIYAALLVLALIVLPTISVADKPDEKKDDKKEEKKDEKKDDKKDEEKDDKKDERPWSEDELKAFLKPGLKITYSHQDGILVGMKPLVVTLETEVLKVDDDIISARGQDYDMSTAGGKVVIDHIDIDFTQSWSEARSGLFSYSVDFSAKLTKATDKLKIDGKTYACTVYTKTDDDGETKKWWVSIEVPGVILKYEETETALAMGKMRRAVATAFEATKLEIPRESKKPKRKR